MKDVCCGEEVEERKVVDSCVNERKWERGEGGEFMEDERERVGEQ